MKNKINIWNPTTGNKVVTLDELRELICKRRLFALNPLNKNSVKKLISVMTTNKELQQISAHYKSFEIRTFDHKKAVEVFNLGGCQIASL